MKISTITPTKVRGEAMIGYRALDGLREQRLKAYDSIKGRHYMRNRSDVVGDRQPTNLTQQQWRTLVPFLAMNCPSADVQPLRSDLTFEARLRKQIYDHDSEALRLDEVYQDAATEMICSGLCFTLSGLKNGGEKFTAKNRRIDVGQEYTRLLDIDDVTLDPMAKTMPECRFIGHRYTVSREDAIDAVEDGVYGALPEDYEDGILPNENIATPDEAVEILSNLSELEVYGRRTDRVDDNDGERYVSGERLDETIVLWDIVFYMHGETWIVTIPGSPGQYDVFPAGTPDKFLAVQKWRGVGNGPINVGTFLRVPFNKIPVAIEQMQRDLSDIADLVSNKIVRQTLRTKMVTVYAPSEEETAMTMRKSSEGGYIRGNPNGIKQVQDGGLVPEMLPSAQYISDQWQNATGNLAMAAGSGDLGKTATAFEGLMGRIQGYLDFLRKRIEQLATDDLKVRVWFLNQNPIFSRSVPIMVGQAPDQMTANTMVAMPGAPMADDADYVLQGQHDDFSIKTRAYSMQYNNPAISAQQVTQVLTTVLPVVLEWGAQGAIDTRLTMSMLAQMLNQPMLENIIPDPAMQQLQQQQAQEAAMLDADPTGQNPPPGPSSMGNKVPRSAVAGRGPQTGPMRSKASAPMMSKGMAQAA